MSTIPVNALVSIDELVKAVERLSSSELDGFVSEVLKLRAQRVASCLSERETELLLSINEGVSSDVRRRYDELIQKRDAESLTEAEHAQLLELTDQVELIQAKRIGCLAELAQLRGTTLGDLMRNLGIQPADV